MKFNLNKNGAKARSIYKMIFILLLVLAFDFYSFKTAYETEKPIKSNLVTTEFIKRKLKVGRVWKRFVGVNKEDISISVSMILDDNQAILAAHFPNKRTESIQILTVTPGYKSVFLHNENLYTFKVKEVNSKERFVVFSLREEGYK